nr:hypothetical protein [Bifidobacterium bifidum]
MNAISIQDVEFMPRSKRVRGRCHWNARDSPPNSALRPVAMTEEVAHTMWAARQLGDIIEIPQADIDKLNDRYQNVYGQH